MKRRRTQTRPNSTALRSPDKESGRDGGDDPPRKEKVVVEKMKCVKASDWVADYESLMARMEKNGVALGSMTQPGKFCTRCGKMAAGTVSMAAHQLGEAGRSSRVLPPLRTGH